MEKRLNMYRNLKPEIRFQLTLFVLASLIWVPVRRDTGVEVYEPYKYGIEDVGENQMVFGYRYINYAWAEQDDMWVIQKDGTCRLMDLTDKAGYGRKFYGLTDAEKLEWIEQYMQEPVNPTMEEKLLLDKERINYCINFSHIRLKTRSGVLMDGATEVFYVVVGSGEERRLQIIQERGGTSSSCYDLKIQYVCDAIEEICRYR